MTAHALDHLFDSRPTFASFLFVALRKLEPRRFQMMVGEELNLVLPFSVADKNDPQNQT